MELTIQTAETQALDFESAFNAAHFLYTKHLTEIVAAEKICFPICEHACLPDIDYYHVETTTLNYLFGYQMIEKEEFVRIVIQPSFLSTYQVDQLNKMHSFLKNNQLESFDQLYSRLEAQPQF